MVLSWLLHILSFNILCCGHWLKRIRFRLTWLLRLLFFLRRLSFIVLGLLRFLWLLVLIDKFFEAGEIPCIEVNLTAVDIKQVLLEILCIVALVDDLLNQKLLFLLSFGLHQDIVIIIEIYYKWELIRLMLKMFIYKRNLVIVN